MESKSAFACVDKVTRHTDSHHATHAMQNWGILLMLKIALLVDGWNLLKAAYRVRRRVNLSESPHIVVGSHDNRHIVFQRFYVGPITGRNAQQRVGQIAHEARAAGFEWVSCATDGGFAKSTVDTQITTDLLTWSYCHSVDVLALREASGDGGYAEAVQRAKALGLRVGVYAVKASHHLSVALERSANLIHDLEALDVLQPDDGDALDGLHEGHAAEGLAVKI